MLAQSPPREYDVERAAWTAHTLETKKITDPSFEMLDTESPPTMQTGRASTSRLSNTMNPACGGSPVGGEGRTGSHPNEEPTTTTVPWHGRILASFTLYSELSVASTPEEFASVRSRLQQEWSFGAGFLVGIAAVNATILAITADSSFKIDSHAHTAVAISSATCGLGIVCDVWFLLRYNWVDLDSFIYRSRDVYGSYISFSLSSRIPALCMLVSSVSLMAFLGVSLSMHRP